MKNRRGPYKLFFTKSAQKDYQSIRDSKLKRGINRTLEKIQEDPFQFKGLSGPLAGLRSAKTFSYRILYQIEGNQLIIYVVTIEHRRQSYR